MAVANTPQILVGLADAEAQLAEAQSLLASALEDINTENASFTASMNGYRTALLNATNSALYYGVELASGGHIDAATAQAGLAAARAAAASAQASIASLTASHQSTIAGYTAQVRSASGQVLQFDQQVRNNLGSITVSVQPHPQLVEQGATVNFTATVGDPYDGGVTWELIGAGGNTAYIGTLSNVESTSVTYTAPSSVGSTGPTPVQLTARSVTNPQISAVVVMNLWGPATTFWPWGFGGAGIPYPPGSTDMQNPPPSVIP